MTEEFLCELKCKLCGKRIECGSEVMVMDLEYIRDSLVLKNRMWLAHKECVDKKWKGDKIQKALDVAFKYGSTDGSHHKMWVIDQMVRALTGDKYEDWVRKVKEGDEGPETYGWEEGIPP